MRSAANCEADRHGVRGRSAAGSGAAACAIAMSKSCWPSGGIEVDHVTMYRWVQTLTPEFIHAARPARPATGDRWSSMRPTSKVAGRWTYLYRAVDRHGQAINVRVSYRRDAAAAREFFVRALRCGSSPTRCPATRLPRIPGCGRGRNSAARKERDSRGIAQESAVPLFPVAGFPVGLTSSSVGPPSSPTPRLETELSPFGSKQEPPIGREDDAARALEVVRPVDQVDWAETRSRRRS
jgi:hypothetical protein